MKLESHLGGIGSSATAPQAMPREDEVASIFNKATTLIATKYPPADLALMGAPVTRQTDRRKVCQITTDLFKELLKNPPEEGGKAIKFVMGSK